MIDSQLAEGWIDDIADRFEDAWRKGTRPRIEDFVDADLSNGLDPLLEELVCIDVHHRRRVGEVPLPEEYLARFADHRAAVEAGFPAARGSGPAKDTDLFPDSVGGQVLLGLLALQHSFVDRVTLVGAFKDWVADKTRGIGDILVDRGELTAVHLALLETLAAETVKQYDGDLNRSLVSRGSLDTVRDDLAKLHDTDLDATLTGLSTDARTVVGSEAPARNGKPSASPGFLDARYRIIKRINGGGQGDVYLAMDEALNRKVALKRIKRRYAYSAEFQARMLVEAEVAARLEHPAFLPVHSVGFDAKGLPYFVMQYIEGNSSFSTKIAEYHDPSNPVRSPDERAQGLRKLLRHFVDVCYAVAYAHDRGVIHRDIKPANVLVGQFGETYLVDWGMVKFVEPAATVGPGPHERIRPSSSYGSVFTVEGGTLPYMSPEQIARRPINLATDVYSLGVTLYILLTGKMAFSGTRRAEIAAKIEQGRFQRPRAFDKRVPAALEAICLKAMKLRPQERYATAKEMASHLENWLADRPIAVYREPLPQRVRRWARNHKPAVAGLVVLIITSFLYLIVTDTLLRREQARTEVNFDLARNGLLRLLRVAAVPPKSQSDRRDIASTALKSARTFLESRPGDRSVGLDVARTFRAIANMGRTVGEVEEPSGLYREAAQLLDDLQVRNPGDPEIAVESVLNAIEAGELPRMNGQPEEAIVVFESVIKKIGVVGSLSTANQQRAMALALVNLAKAQNQADDARGARRSGLLAIELLNKLGTHAVIKPDGALLLLLAQTEMGIAEESLDNDPAAIEQFTHAIEKGKALVAAEHDTPEVRHAYFVAMGLLARRLAANPGQKAEGALEFTTALLGLRSLTQVHPHVPLYHRDLATTYVEWADFFLVRGTNDETTEDFNTSAEVELGEYAKIREQYDFHRELGRVLSQRARFARAKNDLKTADSLFARAIDEHTRALRPNRPCRTDHRLLEKVREERARPR